MEKKIDAKETSLEDNLNYFNEIRESLIAKYQSGHAIIHEKKVIDVLKNREDALKKAYEIYEDSVPFLVKQIEPDSFSAFNFSRDLKF